MSSTTDFRSCPGRPFRPLFSLLLAATSLLSLTGCVTTNLAPISVHGAAYKPLPDEIDLWLAASEEESLMLGQAEVYEDPALEHYLGQLVARLEPPGMAANPSVRFRVTVLDDPTFNAFAYPNGSIYIHSGLLAQTDTEDQIAAILAHEMTHVENRHMARHERARWNRMAPIGALAIGVSLALTIEEVDALEDCDYEEAEILEEMADDVFFFGLELASRVSARGYGRRLEREADEGMLHKLRANGYDVAHVMEFYDSLNGLADLGDSRQVLAHGLGSDVAQRLRALVTPASPDSAPGGTPLLAPAELDRLLHGVLRDDVELHLDAGRTEQAQQQMTRVLRIGPAAPETRHLIEQWAAAKNH